MKLRSNIVWMLLIGFEIIFALILSREKKDIVLATQETCPHDNGWIKIDSNDLSLYPVTGATEYCFKAGSDNSNGCTGGIFSSIPSGGFVQPYCGLSHWSYYLPASPIASPSPSTTCSSRPSPTPSPSPSPTCSSSPRPTLTPSPEPSPDLSPSPSAEPSVSPSPEPSVNPSPSPEASMSPNPSPSNNNSSNNNSSSSSDTGSNNNNSNSDNQGEVLGTYASTGIVEDSLFALMNPIGGVMTLAGTILYGQKKSRKTKK